MSENPQTPRLSHFIEDGSTLKPDALVDKEVTIVDSIAVQRKDGSIAHKWVVEWQHGELGLYWAAGMAPPLEVAKWFRDNPGLPLRVIVRRKDVGNGYPHWALEQVDGPASAAFTTDANAALEVAIDSEDIPF